MTAFDEAVQLIESLSMDLVGLRRDFLDLVLSEETGMAGEVQSMVISFA